MKAIINEELVKKSWSGRTILNKTIIGTKENIISKVNDYISERISNKNLIKVKNFTVHIYTQKGKKIDKWEYKPTYR